MLFGTQAINDKGRLEVGGVDTVDLAQRFGTPLYVMDEEAIRQRCREYLSAFGAEAPGTAVAFAAKAFLCRAAAALAAEEGLHLDVASEGELQVVLKAGVPPERITLHGNYKKEEEITAAIEAGVGLLAADGLDDLRAISRRSAAMGRRQEVIVRVSPGIDGHTLDAISTGRNDTKFGLTVESGAALRGIEELLELPGVVPAGLHAHIGSQILTLDPFDLLARRMVAFSDLVSQRTGWLPPLLVLGGGLGIRYQEGDHPPPVLELARTIARSVRRAAEERGLAVPRLGVEPGRSLVGEFGLTLYRVGPVLEVPSGPGATRSYAIVDGGLSDNPRPLMYGARYPAMLADRAAEPLSHTVRIAGRHCETDTLFDAQLPPVRPGNLLAVFCTGAYNHVMASNYNSFCRPPVVFVRKGDARIVVRRETTEDLLRRDVF